MSTLAYQQHELSRFLSGKRATVSSTASMTGMGDSPLSRGKWLISDDDYPRFLDLLHDYLFVKRGRPMAFVEQPRRGEAKPLLVDLDFKYTMEHSLTRAFTMPQIRSFCELLVRGIQTFFGTEAYEELRFFVTLRPAPYKVGSSAKDGVHIMCPDITLLDEKQCALRNWMLSQGAVQECFGSTGFVNAPEDIYDESMVRKQGWIFYGESKPNLPPYELKAVFKYLPAADEWEEDDVTEYGARDLMELLSVRYNIAPDDTVVLEEARDQYDAMRRGPGGGAAGGAHGPETAGEGETAIVAAGAAAAGTQDAGGADAMNPLLAAMTAIYGNTEAGVEEKQIIRRFVMECLKQERADKYESWIRVGWCLHNIDPTEDGFQLWMDFSARSPKSSGNNTAQLRRDWFLGMRKDGDGPRLTERSLRKWARDDNLEQYMAICNEFLGEYIRQELEPSHFHVAKLMKKMFGNNYIASVTSKSIEWFKYSDDENMWAKLNQGIELRCKVSCEVAKAISDSIGRLYSQMERLTPDAREILQKKAKDLIKVQQQLYSNGFTEGVMKMAVQQFYEEDFQSKLNVNPFLFGCKNGVLELRVPGADGREHVMFRQGRPEDYVSFLAGQNQPLMDPINYVPYDPNDPLQIEIADFFDKLFPDPEVRTYTLRLLASCLEGANREQRFYVMTGVGGNGKSKLMDLMRFTLGDYQTSLQTTVLTRKRPESGAANPDIMAAKAKRFIYLQEPDDKEPLNTSRMKQFSGEDMVEARALYGDQEKFIIMGKLFMMCNRLPPVTTMDRGTWRRIRVVEFVSKFVDPQDPELLAGRPNVFPRDPKLEHKMLSWREAFLGLLVHIYETEYIPLGLNPEPAAVLGASNKYKEAFDTYARFKAERIREPRTPEEKLECRESPMTTQKIRQIMTNWKRENRVEGLDIPAAMNRLTEEFGEPVNGKEWPMLRVFASDDEVQTWDTST